MNYGLMSNLCLFAFLIVVGIVAFHVHWLLGCAFLAITFWMLSDIFATRARIEEARADNARREAGPH